MANGYPSDVRETYLDGTATGAIGAVVSIAFEGPDQLLRALSGREYEAPQGIAGRTRRDLWDLIGHISEGEIVPAASAALSIVSGDMVVDACDAITGKYDHGALAA